MFGRYGCLLLLISGRSHQLVNMPDPTFRPCVPTKFGKNTLVDKILTSKTVNCYFPVSNRHKTFAFKFPEKSTNIIILMHGVKAILGNSKGEVKIINGATPESIVQNPLVFQLISKWFSKL